MRRTRLHRGTKVVCCTVLYCTVLYCTVLLLYCYCTVLYCTLLYFTVLYCTVLYVYFTVLYCTVLYCTVLYLYFTVSNRTVLYCTHCICAILIAPRHKGTLAGLKKPFNPAFNEADDLQVRYIYIRYSLPFNEAVTCIPCCVIRIALVLYSFALYSLHPF
jgi:hypothetical protein